MKTLVGSYLVNFTSKNNICVHFHMFSFFYLENLVDTCKLNYNDEQPLKLFLRTGTLQDIDDQQKTKVYNPEVQIENFPLELIKCLPRLNE